MKIRKMRPIRYMVLAGLLVPTFAAAQSSGSGGGVGAACAEIPMTYSADTADFCYSVAQAVESLQPQVGIAVAGGNVTAGSATRGGIRLLPIPGLTLSAKLNVAAARIPDITDPASGAGRTTRERSVPVPVVQGVAAFGLFSGFSASPTLGGIGGLDLLGSVSWLPLNSSRDFGKNSAAAAFGVGGRVTLLKESFVTPGVSLSVMYHDLGRVSYGNVCDPPGATAGFQNDEFRFESGACAGGGDPGEFNFDLQDWSTRAQVGKRFGPFGVAAGLGYDRWSSEIDYGFRGSCIGVPNCFVRVSDVQLDSDRLSTFADASFGGVLGAVVGEIGWMQGSAPIGGYQAALNDFDPKSGTFFGSVGVKLSF